MFFSFFHFMPCCKSTHLKKLQTTILAPALQHTVQFFSKGIQCPLISLSFSTNNVHSRSTIFIQRTKKNKKHFSSFHFFFFYSLSRIHGNSVVFFTYHVRLYSLCNRYRKPANLKHIVTIPSDC